MVGRKKQSTAARCTGKLLLLLLMVMALKLHSNSSLKGLSLRQLRKEDLNSNLVLPTIQFPALPDRSVEYNPNPIPLNETVDNKSFKFPESDIMHRYLDGLEGVEVGSATHNGFGLHTVNVDFTFEPTLYQKEQIDFVGQYRRVDVKASADRLPWADGVVDFVLSSHVIEHFHDPIKVVCEWLRVVRVGGYVAIIAPHKERTFDKDRERTPWEEIRLRHYRFESGELVDAAFDSLQHWCVWITDDFLEIAKHMHWKVVEWQDADDKVGNGFTIIMQKTPSSLRNCPVQRQGDKL
ncbi:Methyltransferase, type 11 [Seminavis robusta]|uniref:Methyltransferase, type 11 n=1 Tax=Seminavis robusta TaxID=568900 RepID=A0A9N8HXE5_9STRA|nr:Methyltransferase, type 11 [Seminavis robusta]|eukprot:Sro2192_g318430.1 Methyltransferase, type 11 (294) ;mRNA; f:10475-11356